MAYAVYLRALERLRLALLIVSAASPSVASECNDFEMRRGNNIGGDWRCFPFEGSGDCFMCFLGKDKETAELLLPCSDSSQSSVKRQLQISYIFRQGNSGSKDTDMSPSFIIEEGESKCQDEYRSATPLQKDCPMQSSPKQRRRSDFQSEMVKMFDINSAISYRLKIELEEGSTVCLTNLEFSNLSTSDDKTNTEPEQTQSSFPIWVIVVIILIVVIGVFAVVGVFIRQRNHQDHQPDSNVNTETTDGHSNQIKETSKHDKDVILNPTYGQDPVSEKDEEYHSYTEIDVKVPANSEMIYNSAYESQPPNSGMTYNSAYESSSN